jgi:predicted HAD superfamily Cof-like phosphohydrolase
MKAAQAKVFDFMKTAGQPIDSDEPEKLLKARSEWINDELIELAQADILHEVADAYLDILYFALGGLIEWGEAVHDLPWLKPYRSPMTPSYVQLHVRATCISQTVLDMNFNLVDSEAVIEGYQKIVLLARDGLAECGLDGEPLFNEVHRSNMTKFIDGRRREDGKWLKGPGFEPPQLQRLILAQMEERR